MYKYGLEIGENATTNDIQLSLNLGDLGTCHPGYAKRSVVDTQRYVWKTNTLNGFHPYERNDSNDATIKQSHIDIDCTELSPDPQLNLDTTNGQARLTPYHTAPS